MTEPSGQPASPTVSVVIPCYEQAQYLPDAVESVVAQTYRDWEIVIVDDGSPDDTATVTEQLISANRDRRIRLVRQSNHGLSGARNAGIAAATGLYILPLDADDILESEMLERTVAVLESEPAVSIVYSDQRYFGAIDRIVRTPAWDVDMLRRRNLFSYASLFRRMVWETVGGYDESMRLGYEDWDFWISAAERGLIARRVPLPLLRYRVRPGSMLVRARQRHEEIVSYIERKHAAWYSKPWRRWRRWPARLARRARHVLSGAAGEERTRR